MVQVTYNPTTYSTDDTGIAQVSSAELTGTVPCTAPESAAVLVVPTSWDDGMVIADPNPQALEPSAVQAMAPVRIYSFLKYFQILTDKFLYILI